MDCSMPGLPVLHYLPEFAQTHVHWVSDAIQPSHPLSPPSPLALHLSQHQGLLKWVSSCIRWPKYWSFTISPFNEYSGLISFRIDWFDLLAFQGRVSGATLGITDKMEARPQPPLLILQARSRDEGVMFCDSDLFFPFFGWVGWKEC